MIQQCLNTLYVQSPEAHVRLDHDTLRVTIGEEEAVRVPSAPPGGRVLFGGASMSQGASNAALRKAARSPSSA